MNQTAQGLAALGRGPDTMLVHMAPEEVAGLQALALKHGGTLTINPETGLAEAGFLKSILPMVAGFALGPAGFGLMSSAMAGLTVGGISALSSGSLEKGLMAGLGAYGGSELGVGFSNAAPAPEALAPATSPAVAQAPNVAAIGSSGPPTLANAATGPASGFNPAFNPAASTFQAPVAPPAFPTTLTPPPPVNIGPTPVSFDRAVSGFKAVTDSPGAALAFAKDNVMPLTTLGIAALSSDDKKGAKPNDPGMIRPYTYSRTKVPGAFDRTANDPMSSRERQYFNDQYTALTPYKAPGPEYMAEGGPVEAMSDANAIGMNTGYPQSDIRTGAYATPYQQPISRNVVTGVQDAGVNPYTGQAQFADGGSVGGYTFDPRTGLYTRPGGQGATTVSPTGDISGASGSSGGNMQPIDPRTAAFFDNETPQERDARMMSVDRAIGAALGFVPGPIGALAGLSNLANSGQLGTLAGGIANFFGGTQAPAPVDSLGTSLGGGFGSPAAQGQTSSQSGEGNPGEQGGQTSSDTGTGNPGESYAQGGIANLGDYSDGGRLLRGPGDGVSDDIPAMIGQKQQARLADGEFVVPARIVSELGNGSTEAGARQLYAMMDRVQKARKKTVGKDKVATNSRAAKLLPA